MKAKKIRLIAVKKQTKKRAIRQEKKRKRGRKRTRKLKRKKTRRIAKPVTKQQLMQRYQIYLESYLNHG